MAWEWLPGAATVAGAMVGASVGVAGMIINSRLQREILKAQLRADQYKGLLTEKRSVYARFLAQVEVVRDLAAEAMRLRDQLAELEGSVLDAKHITEKRMQVLDDMRGGVTDLRKLEAEVLVLGGVDLGAAANLLTTALSRSARQPEEGPKVRELYVATLLAMHRDVDLEVGEEKGHLLRLKETVRKYHP